MSGAEDPKPEAIVIDMVNAGRLIREAREAREAREQRKAERGKSEAVPFPAGLDDMEF